MAIIDAAGSSSLLYLSLLFCCRRLIFPILACVSATRAFSRDIAIERRAFALQAMGSTRTLKVAITFGISQAVMTRRLF